MRDFFILCADMKIPLAVAVVLVVWIQVIESSTVPQIVAKLSKESEFYLKQLEDAHSTIRRKIDNDLWKMNLTAVSLKRKVDGGPEPCKIFYPQVQYLQNKMKVQFPLCELENELGELEQQLTEITRSASRTAALCRQQNCQYHLDHLDNRLSAFHEKISKDVDDIKKEAMDCVRKNMDYYCKLFETAEEQWGNCVGKV